MLIKKLGVKLDLTVIPTWPQTILSNLCQRKWSTMRNRFKGNLATSGFEDNQVYLDKVSEYEAIRRMDILHGSSIKTTDDYGV